MQNQSKAEGDSFPSSHHYQWHNVVSPLHARVKIATQRGDGGICHQINVRHSLTGSFGIGKGWSFQISWNSEKPSALTTTSEYWLSWRLEHPEKNTFSCNAIMPGSIPFKDHCGHCQSCLDCPVTPTTQSRFSSFWLPCFGQWKMDYLGNIFLLTALSQQTWNSASPPMCSTQAFVLHWQKKKKNQQKMHS